MILSWNQLLNRSNLIKINKSRNTTVHPSQLPCDLRKLHAHTHPSTHTYEVQSRLSILLTCGFSLARLIKPRLHTPLIIDQGMDSIATMYTTHNSSIPGSSSCAILRKTTKGIFFINGLCCYNCNFKTGLSYKFPQT